MLKSLSRLFSEPPPDYGAIRRKWEREIERAASYGDAFIIDHDLIYEYEKAGGKRKDLADILKIAYQRAYEKDLELAKRIAKSHDIRGLKDHNLMGLKLLANSLHHYAQEIGKGYAEIEEVINSMPPDVLKRYNSMRI